MKRYTKIILLIIMLLSVSSVGLAQNLPRVAVVAITSTDSKYSWNANSPIAESITDLMINALINTNQFRVFERSKLSSIVNEQQFQNFSGLVDPSTAVKMGKMIGVDVIITGALTSISFGKGGGISIGGISISSSSVKVMMTVRAISVATGEILYSTNKTAKASKSSISGVLPVAGGLGLSQKQSISLMSAIKKICDDVAMDFAEKVKAKNLSIQSAPKEGYVVKVLSTSSGGIIKVYTNLGKNSGIKVGQEIKIYRKGEAIVDPKTNEVLDQELELLARAKIIKVKDKISIALVTNKLPGPPIKPTDIVQIAQPK